MKDGHHWGYIPMWGQLPGVSEGSLSVFLPQLTHFMVYHHDLCGQIQSIEFMTIGSGPTGWSYDWFAYCILANQWSAKRIVGPQSLFWTSQAPQCHLAQLCTPQTVFLFLNGPHLHMHAQSCPTRCDPMYCSPLASSVYGIFQVAISFSWMGPVYIQSLDPYICSHSLSFGATPPADFILHISA